MRHFEDYELPLILDSLEDIGGLCIYYAGGSERDVKDRTSLLYVIEILSRLLADDLREMGIGQ